MNNEPNNKTENKQQIIFKFSSADILFGTCEGIKQNKKIFMLFWPYLFVIYIKMMNNNVECGAHHTVKSYTKLHV